MASPATGFIEAAVAADVTRLTAKGTEGLAALALAIARRMDAGMSATAYSQCGKTLLDTLDRMRALVPPEEDADDLDELAARRAKRLAAAAD